MITETDLIRLFPDTKTFEHLERNLIALGASDVNELQIDVTREKLADHAVRLVFLCPTIEDFVRHGCLKRDDRSLEQSVEIWRKNIGALVDLKDENPRQITLISLEDCAWAGEKLSDFLGVNSVELEPLEFPGGEQSILHPVARLCQLLIREQLQQDKELSLELKRLDLAFTPMTDDANNRVASRPMDKPKLDFAIELAKDFDRLYGAEVALEKELANADLEVEELRRRCHVANKNSLSLQELADGHRMEAQRLNQELSSLERRHTATLEEFSEKLIAASSEEKRLVSEMDKLRSEFELKVQQTEGKIARLVDEKERLDQKIVDCRLKLERAAHASELLISERNQLAEHLVEMKESNSWKLTAPVRAIVSKIRTGASDERE